MDAGGILSEGQEIYKTWEHLGRGALHFDYYLPILFI
jgi:hypothetical protein